MKTPLARLVVAALVAAACCLAPSTAVAQEDASFASFQFNRSLPGARSLALAGAFVALADDATAAYANPAGLSQLERPEVSFEARRWRSTTEHTDRGRIGFEVEPDLFSTGEAESDTSGLSFASFVWATPDRPWTVGLYRHQVASFETSFASQGVRNNGSPPLFGPYTFSTHFDVVNTGVSASWSFDGRWSLGVGVSHQALELLSIERVFPDPPPGVDSDFSNILARGGKEADDADWTVNVGVLVQLGPRLTLGAAYRQAPSFAMREFFQGSFDVTSTLNLPHQWALGLAVRPTDRITVSLEVDHVEYSRMLDGNRFTGDFPGFRLDDGTEVRLGLETDIALGKGRLLTLAVGGWYDPDHTIVFEGAGNSTGGRFRQAYFRDVGDDAVHAAFGAGLTIGKLQLNLAADLSSRIDTTSVSIVYWF